MGDAEICPVCNQIWIDGQRYIQCSTCLGWIHHNNRKNCSGLTNREFKMHCDNDNKFWECDKCFTKAIYTLPFCHLDEENWNNFNGLNRKISTEDTNSLSADDQKFLAHCESIQTIINTENGDNDALLNHVNFKYYDEKNFNCLKIDLPSSFGLFHGNIASLNLHIDDLRQILATLDYKLDVIGISEHKIRKDSTPSSNISIPGYDEFIFEPTETSHGGTGFYIKNNTDYILRKDLQINSCRDFESIFIEIQFPKQKNLIINL